jgi:hypothetical protein
MQIDNRKSRRAGSGIVLLAMLATAGVTMWPAMASADDDDGLSQSWSDKLSDGLKNTIGGATKAMGMGKPAGPPPKESPSGCPTIAILDGTEVQRVMAPGTTGNAGLKYQYSLYNVGRECSLSGGRMSVKIGADGRVLLGPAGTPSRFDVPIRVVVYSEVTQKPVESRLFRVPVTMGGGQASVPFQFVSDNINVTIAGGSVATDYSIKVGIDGAKGGATATPTRTSRAHRRQKEAQSTAQ